MVLEVRDLWPEIPIAVGALRNPMAIAAARWLERMAYKSSARIIALSPGMADGIIARGYPRNNVSVVPNSCDNELFSGEGICDISLPPEFHVLDRGRIVVYAGTFGLVNRVEYLAEIAYSMLEIDPTILFVAVGGGGEQQQLRATADSLGVLGRNFWIMPSVHKRQMPAVLRKASLAISLVVDIPVMRNNCANKFFDALSAGRPIAINHEGWQADLIRDKEIGIVVPPNDPAGAASQIRNFMDFGERLQNAGARAAELSRTVFSRDRLAAEVLSTLESVVAVKT